MPTPDRRGSRGARSTSAIARIRSARDRRQDAVVQRGRAERAGRIDPEDRRRRRLEHAAVRRDEQRLVEPAPPGQAAGQHVGRVGERLDPVEHAGRRVGHRTQAHRARTAGERLCEEHPPPLAGQDHAQHPVEGLPAPRLQKLGGLPLEVGPRDRLDQQARRGVLEPVQVILEGEGAAVVDADDLERAVAAQEALIGGGDHGLARGHDLPVHARQVAGVESHDPSLDGAGLSRSRCRLPVFTS